MPVLNNTSGIVTDVPNDSVLISQPLETLCLIVEFESKYKTFRRRNAFEKYKTCRRRNAFENFVRNMAAIMLRHHNVLTLKQQGVVFLNMILFSYLIP